MTWLDSHGADAWRIAEAINWTWDRNASEFRKVFEDIFGSQKEYGDYCYNWAWAFHKAAQHEGKTGFFKFEVEQAVMKGKNDPNVENIPVHYWLKISMAQDPKRAVYVDDGFKGGFVHLEPPIPPGYEAHGGLWLNPGDGQCSPPPSYDWKGDLIED
jgi:hypothetical protein